MSNKEKVFEFLYKNSEGRFNINQISKLTGVSVGSAFKILKELELHSLLTAYKEKNAIYYKIKLNARTAKFYSDLLAAPRRYDTNKTKIMATLREEVSNARFIRKMIDTGVNCLRIDVGPLDESSVIRIIQSVRLAVENTPILLDIGAASRELQDPWIKLALAHEIEFLAVSTINKGEDALKLNKQLGYKSLANVIGDKIKIIAKLETRESLSRYREIIREVYGVFLDEEKINSLKQEYLPKVQKKVIEECRVQGRPVIVAGTILKSMQLGEGPTKLEIYDIANSIYQGASCLLLSDEAAQGKCSFDAVKTLKQIIAEVETEIDLGGPERSHNPSITGCIANAIVEIDKSLSIDAIIAITSGGYTARMLASRKLKSHIIAISSQRKTIRQMQILWGVIPLELSLKSSAMGIEEKKRAILHALNQGLINKTDRIIIVASVFPHKNKRANLLEVHDVAEFLRFIEDSDKDGCVDQPLEYQRPSLNSDTILFS